MESNKDNKASKIKVRMQIQKLLEKNLRPSTAMFGCKELSESTFINDLFTHFDIELKKV